MKHYLMIAASLTATLTAGAVASPSASAAGTLPALYECAKVKKNGATKKYEGAYEKGCVTKNAKGEGKYEIKEGFGKGKVFKAKGGGANLNIPIGGIDCLKSSAVGRFTSTTTGDATATFEDCEFNGKKCNSAGAASGTIVTDPLVAVVGYLKGQETLSSQVGAAFSAESGEVLAAFDCGADDFAVTGSVIGEVTPINKFSKEAVFAFRQKAVGVQEWESFEGGLNQHLTAHLCEDCENPLVNRGTAASEELEIKAKTEELELRA